MCQRSAVGICIRPTRTRDDVALGWSDKKMKRLVSILLGGVLALSLALNIFLWGRLSSQNIQLRSAQASATEIDELRRQNQELQINPPSAFNSAGADGRELAQLRNEVSQLRKQAAEVLTLRAQAEEAARLRARLATATQDLARAESELADAVKLSPEQMQQLKEEAQSVQCVNSLKQIGLAARLWAKDHGDVFPPDFISMRDYLATPKILFCPADAVATRVSDWPQLDPSSISYRFLNPNGNASDPAKPLTTCPIHGHTVLSDASVQRQ